MSTPQFHIWNYRSDAEVRLTQEFIDRIRSMTVKKKILVQDKESRLGYGWKKPHRRRFYMEKEVKLIAEAIGHPYYSIAHRLYPKIDWHSRDRPVCEHFPFISVEECCTVSKVTGIPLEELEKHVIEVRNGRSSRHRTPMRFPVTANEDWGWLFGLWYSSGGLVSRVRIDQGYPTEERSVRFRVDAEVFNSKIEPLLARICGAPYTRKLADPWYINKGIDHPLDMHRRKGLGNQPRKVFHLLRPIREIMEWFGLPQEVSQKIARPGARFASRKYNPTIPRWIRSRKTKTHAFVEGYINGGSTASNFRGEHKHGKKYPTYLHRDLELRFSSFTETNTMKFFNLLPASLPFVLHG